MKEALPDQWVHLNREGYGRGQVLYGLGSGQVRVAFANLEEVVHVSTLTDATDPDPAKKPRHG